VVEEIKRSFPDVSCLVHMPQSVKEMKLGIDADTFALSAELGRSPSRLSSGERSKTTVEQVMELLAARTTHHRRSDLRRGVCLYTLP